MSTVIGEITVNVTQEDIDHGLTVNCTGCPIALAIRRAVGSGLNPWVGTGMVNLWPNGPTFPKNRIATATARLPDEAREFIRCFDNRIPVQPIDFALTFT